MNLNTESEMQVKQDSSNCCYCSYSSAKHVANCYTTWPKQLQSASNCNLGPSSASLLLPPKAKWRSAMLVIIRSWDPDHSNNKQVNLAKIIVVLSEVCKACAVIASLINLMPATSGGREVRKTLRAIGI